MQNLTDWFLPNRSPIVLLTSLRYRNPLQSSEGCARVAVEMAVQLAHLKRMIRLLIDLDNYRTHSLDYTQQF